MAGGGALRTASLLHYLASRYDVDLVVFRQPGAPDPAKHLPPGLAHRVVSLELSPNSRTFAARALRNASRVARQVPPLVDRFSGFGDAVARAIAGRRYEVAVVEHFWCAPYQEQISPAARRTVLDLHNIESVLHARCAAVEPAAEAFAHGIFERAARDLERLWLPRYSSVLTTSAADAAIARQIAPEARVSVYPNAIAGSSAPPQLDEEAVVFSGNMEYHPNRTAVRFFRREIWPALRERWPQLVWRLVGKNPGAIKEFTAGDPRIEVRGPVDDAVAELARCRLAVAPLLVASGTRLKILEAWAAGLPVVSTSVGAEGLDAIDGEHLLLADRAEAFAAQVTRLLACKTMRIQVGMAGRLLLEKEFTWEKAWDRLDF